MDHKELLKLKLAMWDNIKDVDNTIENVITNVFHDEDNPEIIQLCQEKINDQLVILKNILNILNDNN